MTDPNIIEALNAVTPNAEHIPWALHILASCIGCIIGVILGNICWFAIPQSDWWKRVTGR